MLGAREELKRLFRDEELPFWGVCHPSPVARRALDAHQPPPSAGTYGLHGYERLSAELREVLKELICWGSTKFFGPRTPCTTPKKVPLKQFAPNKKTS